MRDYKLYKIADGNKDEEAKRQAMMQALMALGGGGLGYLMTRYGLGLKGAGAGIAGAGIGAVAGAGAGAVVNRMSRDEQKKIEDFGQATDEAIVTAGRPWTEAYKEGLDPRKTDTVEQVAPKVVGAVAATGAAGKSLRNSFSEAGMEATRKKSMDKARKAVADLSGTFTDADDIARVAVDRDKALKIIRRKMSKGIDMSQMPSLLEEIVPTKGLDPDAVKLAQRKQQLIRPILTEAGSQYDIGKTLKHLPAKALKAGGWATVAGVLGNIATGGAVDQISRYGAKAFVDNDLNPRK